MAVNQLTKTELDSALRNSLTAVRNALDNVTELRAYLYSLAADGQTATVLTVLQGNGYSYTQTEAETLLNAVNALNQLRVVANAGATVAQVDDFFFNAKKVWGFARR